jgi:dihydrodipicolinate synthase/N-acetylneuraminate lyase
MKPEDWAGVIPAITTPFCADLAVDEAGLARHVEWLLGAGCRGVVALGSLGESPTLSIDEKRRILAVARNSARNGAVLVAGIAGLSTAECVRLAKAAADEGCDALMVLPPYVYRGDWAETRSHLSEVLAATPLSCMLYNNPVAYGTDILPEQIAELCRHENLHSVKESSGDVRRISAIREQVADRLRIFVGVDDVVVESVAVGAVGWIAGLVNALPIESVRLFDLARDGRLAEALRLNEWFLPLLRMDTVPKFVQLIKLVQAEVGRGTPTVRPPRRELEGDELRRTRERIRQVLARRSQVEDLLSG